MNDFSFKLDIVKSKSTVKSGDWVIVGYASTYDVDTDDTQITREALEKAKNDLLEYSTVLYNHNPDRPIGKVVDTEIDEIGLLVKIVLSKQEEEIWKKVQEGIISKFSIQGRATEMKPVEGTGQIQQITNLELYEVSLVSVPANKEAGTICYWIAKSLAQQNFKKGIVPSHTPAKADENTDWDGSSADGRLRKWASLDGSGDKEQMDWSKYAKGFVYFDSSDKENFGSYKMPHHDIIDGKFVVVWKGVAAAMAALQGARGGLNVPESSKRSIYNHLAKHYKQFDKEIPEFSKSLSETSFNDVNMDKIIKKLNDILSEGEDVKSGLQNFVKELEIESDLLGKLELVSGKLSGEDKATLDLAISLLKQRREEDKEESENCYDLGDESEDAPIFQLNDSAAEVIALEDGNKFRKQLLKKGKWFHWGADGGVLKITDQLIDNVIKNFKKSVIEHVYVPRTHTNDPLMNTGEIVGLEKTDNGLDAIFEIKDETTLDKIKKGLIKCVSASLDANYRVKTSNEYVGPTLLHAALVAEPFIKGMGSFIPLSDDFEGRAVVQLEDEEPNFFSVMQAVKDSLNSIESKVVTSDVFAEEFAKFKIDMGIMKTNEETKETETIETTEETVEETPIEETVEETPEEVVDETTEAIATDEEPKEVTEPAGEEEETTEVEASDEIKKDLDTEKEEETTEETEEEEEEEEEEDPKEIEKSKFTDCMQEEMKGGKNMADAIKACKIKINKSEDLSGEGNEADEESVEENAQSVDLTDAEKLFNEYLEAGKVLPVQKDHFIKLMTSEKKIELGDDNEVGVAEILKNFIDSSKTVIDFEEIGTPLDEAPAEVPAEEKPEIPTEAKEFFSKMGLSGNEAIEASWKNLQEMKQEEDDEKSSLF